MIILNLIAVFAFGVVASSLQAQQAQVSSPASVANGGVGTQSAKHTEDLSNIIANPNDLQAVSVAIIGKSESPDFTRELLRIQWRVADPMDLYVIKPRGVEHPPVILYLYDYTSSTDRFRDDGWCKRVTKGGFAAVGFSLAVTGERTLYRPMKEWFVSELQEALGKSTHDVQMILNYLQSRGDLSVGEVGMFGQGAGGAVAILAAAADPRIKVVDVIDPWGDWPDWLKQSALIPEEERASYIKPEFLDKVKTLDPVSYLPKLKLKALRVQQVMIDVATPPSAKDKIAASVPHPSDLLRHENPQSLMKMWKTSGLSGWLEDSLRPAISGKVEANPRNDHPGQSIGW